MAVHRSGPAQNDERDCRSKVLSSSGCGAKADCESGSVQYQRRWLWEEGAREGDQKYLEHWTVYCRHKHLSSLCTRCRVPSKTSRGRLTARSTVRCSASSGVTDSALGFPKVRKRLHLQSGSGAVALALELPGRRCCSLHRFIASYLVAFIHDCNPPTVVLSTLSASNTKDAATTWHAGAKQPM